MQKVLIVGINSFLSVQLTNLLKGKFEVTGIYNRNRNNIPEDILCFSIEQLDQFIDEYKYVFIISAFVPDKNNNDREKLNEVNVVLTDTLLKKFKNSRFIYTSTVSVYGKQSELINEKIIGMGINDYGLSKLQAEELVKKHTSYAILRISSMYGVGMKTNTFLPIIVKNAVCTNQVTIYGDGARLQNYIHVKDVAEMLYRAAISDENFIGLAVNPKSISNLQVAELVKDCIDELKIDSIGEDNEISYEYEANYTYKILNFIPTIKLKDGIIELIEWIKK